jgi:hypothetical protein
MLRRRTDPKCSREGWEMACKHKFRKSQPGLRYAPRIPINAGAP